VKGEQDRGIHSNDGTQFIDMLLVIDEFVIANS